MAHVFHCVRLVSGAKCQRECPKQLCLKRSSVCDGVVDCRDRSDELNCTRACELLPRRKWPPRSPQLRLILASVLCSDVKGCSSSSYKCSNGKCLSKANPECDGVKDCLDGSDELRCRKLQRSSLRGTPRAGALFHPLPPSHPPSPPQAAAPDPGSALKSWVALTRGRAPGRGRSASRWIATATCAAPHWSPAAGSSLQLTASRTLTLSSTRAAPNPRQPDDECCAHACRLCRYSDARAWRAYMGMRVMTTGSGGGATVRLIRRILLHPKYDQFTSDSDIALLELSSPVAFSELVQPVCVPSPSHTFKTGTSCHVTGWGVLMEDGASREINKGLKPRRNGRLLLLTAPFSCCFYVVQESWPPAYRRPR